MKKETARDIAIALIATSGEQFDLYCFDDSDISETDQDKILREIQKECRKMNSKIEAKYGITLGGSVAGIIDSIVYE